MLRGDVLWRWRFDLLLRSRNATPCPPDVNGDGVVNVLDLIELLLQFGQACP